MQRVTGVANVFLVLWFIVQAVGMSGVSYAEWREWFAQPYHATGMVLLSISTFWHAKLGVQVVIEDYVHCEGLKIASLMALTLACFALGTACVVSTLIIATGGA